MKHVPPRPFWLIPLTVAVSVLCLAACGDDDDHPEQTMATVGGLGDVTPTPLPDEILTVLDALAAIEGWELVGPCETHGEDDPGFVVGTQCYFNVKAVGEELQLAVGNVASEASHRVILKLTAEGEYAVAGVTPVLTPASGK